MDKRIANSQLKSWNTYQMYLREMLSLAENVFAFDGVPENVDISYVNRNLLYKGAVVWFKDEILGTIALPFSTRGNFDIYGNPTEVDARAFNGRYFRRLKQGEFVIMYDNASRYPIYADIVQMAERIALCVKTNDVNIKQQRTPRIWKTSQDMKKSVEDIINNIDCLIEDVTTYDSIEWDDVNVVLAPAPYVADKIDSHLDKLWAEFYRLIGVANLFERKKERVIRDEMRATQGGTIASRFARFEPRATAIKKINEMFGENMSVYYYDGIPTTKEEVEENESNVDNDANVDAVSTNGLQ